MERDEPALVPEWYKGSTGSASASGNSNHHSRSSFRSDEHGVRPLSRNRFSESAYDLETTCSSTFSDGGLSSFRRSVSSNGSLTHDRVTNSNLRSYSSFGRSHRDKDREKDHDLRQRSRSPFLEDGFSNYADSIIGSWNERVTLRRTTSLVGRQGEPLSKRTSSSLSNGVLTGASTMLITDKHSFEREFPSLGIEDKQPDIARVSSPGLTTALDNISRISSTSIGGDGWTSALAEVPARVGGNGSPTSSASPTSLGSSTGLNMAETLSQAPLLARTASQESVDTQKIEELTRLQYSKLIPMKPSMPKSSAHNSLEKSKVKGARTGEYSVLSKVGLQSSSQIASHTPLAPAGSDVAKTSQGGNLQVFNREKNGTTPVARDGLNIRNANKIVGLQVGASTPQPKGPLNMKQISSSTHTSSGEKRPNSQAQNRNEFFNSLRLKATSNRPLPDLRSVCQENEESPASCFGLEHSMESKNGATGDVNAASVGPQCEDETSSFDPVIARYLSDNREESLSSIPDVQCVSDNGDESLPSGSAAKTTCLTVSEDLGSSPELAAAESVPENVDDISSDPRAAPSEEEAAFLRSLGWDENALEDPLTPEEIVEVYQEHPELKASSRLGHSKRCCRFQADCVDA